MKKNKTAQSLKDILVLIEQANDYEISEIIRAVIRRYSKVFPDWEVRFFSNRRDPQYRSADIEAIVADLRRDEA